MTADQLERILEANHRSMVALLASLSTPSAASAETKRPQIKVPKWSDDETPYEYFTKFEKAMSHNGVERRTWGHLLPVYLSGRAQASFAQVDASSLDDYNLVKSTMLESLGDTPASTDRRWWSLSCRSGEEAGAFYLRIRSTGIRRFDGLTTKEELCERVILSRFLSLLFPECYTSVVARQPKTGLEAAKLVQEFEETRSFSQRQQPWRSNLSHQGTQHFKREQGDAGGVASIGGVASSGGCPQNGNVTGAGQSSDGRSSQASESMGEKPVGRNVSDRKQVICYGCGELGHIKPNCPNRVRSVRSVRSVLGQNAASGMLVDGRLAGLQVKGLRVDTGADRTVVHKDFIPRVAYTGKSVVLDSWKGAQFSKHRVARIAIQIGAVKEVAEVAVADNLGYPALLGTDLSSELKVEMMGLLINRLDCDQPKDSEEMQQAQATPIRVTRSQDRRQVLDEKADEVVVAQAAKELVPLSEIFDFSDDYFEPDPVTSTVTELSTGPKEELGQISIPEPGRNIVDLSELLGEQQTDVFLQKSPDVARKETGYGFFDLVEGVLVHNLDDSLAELQHSIVVPMGRKLQVLGPAHSDLGAGHVGAKTTFVRMLGQVLARMSELVGRVRDRAKRAKVKMKVKEDRVFCQTLTGKQAKQFWGLTDYFQRLVQHCADHTFLLTKTTRKSAPARVWLTDDILKDFLFLNESLCVGSSLSLSVFSDKVSLQTVTSGVGLGAVLNTTRKGEELPVTYASKLQTRDATGRGGVTRTSGLSEGGGRCHEATLRHGEQGTLC